MPLATPADAQLANLIQVAWIFLIPIGLLLALVLYKIVCLLQVVLEISTIARYEVYPTLKHVHRITERVDNLSTKVSESVDKMQQTVQKVKPAVEKGTQGFKSGAGKAKELSSTLVRGLWEIIKKRF